MTPASRLVCAACAIVALAGAPADAQSADRELRAKVREAMRTCRIGLQFINWRLVQPDRFQFVIFRFSGNHGRAVDSAQCMRAWAVGQGYRPEFTITEYLWPG